MAQINLSAPWVLYYRKIEEMFKQDPSIRVIFDDSSDKKKLTLYVDDLQKAAGLSELLIPSVTFGETTMTINVVPANANTVRAYYSFVGKFTDTIDMLNCCFLRNRAFAYATKLDGVFTNPIYYVVFSREVVQYFTDDIGDMNGVCSTLYQEIAKEIFKPIDGVHYCTDTSPRTPALSNCYGVSRVRYSNNCETSEEY